MPSLLSLVLDGPVFGEAYKERMGMRVAQIHLEYPKVMEGIPRISWPVSRTGVEATVESFEEVVHKIEARNYDMANVTKTKKRCGDCDFRHHCNPKVYTLKNQ
jgi:DNA helicase-2/ATP-dependent DNA helicase PcrA